MSREKRIFAVLDPDLEFAFRFMEYVKDHSGYLTDVRVFTTEEHLLRSAEEEELTVVLVSSLLLTEAICQLRVRTLVVLQEEPGEIQEELPMVYKYQSPADLLESVQKLCEEKTAGPAVRRKSEDLELFAVYSPVGRTRKTSFALTMGQILAEHHRVLYLNMENYAGFEVLFGEQYQRTISDLLYFCRQEQTNLLEKIEGMEGTLQNLEYIPPVVCPDDLQSVEPEEWMALLKKLAELKVFRYMILDLGDGVQGLTSVLSLCDRIYLPVRTDPVSRAKQQQFIWTLGEAHGKATEQKIRELRLPVSQVGKTGKEYFRELVNSDLGILVREVLQEANGHEL